MNIIETLNKLLKDELLATENYGLALDKLRDNVGLEESEFLRPIYEAHKLAALSLQAQIRRMEKRPARESGAWVIRTKMVQRGSNSLGKEAAQKIMQEVEKNGGDDYEGTLINKISSVISSLTSRTTKAF